MHEEQEPPEGLQEPGCKLWEDVVAAHELRPDELAVLEEAARTVDELRRLETALATVDVVVEGSTGQVRAHPLFSEVRGHRKVLGTLLRQLGLVEVDEGEAPVPLNVSATKRRAANARWDRVRAERGETA